MKNYLLPIFALLITGCGNHQIKQDATTESDSTAELSAVEQMADSLNNIVGGKSLNDIRFENWTKEDWCDNDYFRALRKYIDLCYNGKIENKDLRPYITALKGKFVILTSEPSLMGGMFITICFLDMPNKVFETRVYSDVDEDTNEVSNYEVRSLRLSEDELDMTKEEILALIKKYPQNKLW